MNRVLYNEIANTHLFEMEANAFMNQAKMFLTHYREVNPSPDDGESEPGQFLLSASSGFQEKLYLGDGANISRWADLDESDVLINVMRVSGPMMRNSICTYGSIELRRRIMEAADCKQCIGHIFIVDTPGGSSFTKFDLQMRNSICTYGSIELRRRIMEAADCKQCIGHIFIVDTPGGSSFTKFDLQEAMDYAHSKGQSTAMYVDGMVCSAGMAWGAMCQKRYARHKHCLFGCMGTFSAFYTNKDKDVNEITKEMFHVVYASQSPLKNKSSRDSAEGDDTKMQQELDKSNKQYLEIIRKGIPNATEEQLQGEIYEAGDVIGTLCSGIRTFDEVVREMLTAKGFKMMAPEGRLNASMNGAHEGYAESASSKGKEETPEEDPDDDDDDDDDTGNPDEPGDPNDPVDPNAPDDDEPDKKKTAKRKSAKKKSINKSHYNMSKKYEKIQQALELESLESNKDNSLWLHEELAEKSAKKKSINKSHYNMSKKYEKIQQALELESLESNKDNSLWLHEELADKLNAALDSKEKTEQALEAKVTEIKSLNDKIKQMTEQFNSEKESLQNQFNIDALDSKEKTEQALEAKVTEIKSLNDKIKQMTEQFNSEKESLQNQFNIDKENLKKEVQTDADSKFSELEAKYNNLVSERDELKGKLEQKDKEIEELSNEPSPQKQPGLSGESKKETAALPHSYATVAEQRAAKAEFMRTIQSLK